MHQPDNDSQLPPPPPEVLRYYERLARSLAQCGIQLDSSTQIDPMVLGQYIHPSLVEAMMQGEVLFTHARGMHALSNIGTSLQQCLQGLADLVEQGPPGSEHIGAAVRSQAGVAHLLTKEALKLLGRDYHVTQTIEDHDT